MYEKHKPFQDGGGSAFKAWFDGVTVFFMVANQVRATDEFDWDHAAVIPLAVGDLIGFASVFRGLNESINDHAGLLVLDGPNRYSVRLTHHFDDSRKPGYELKVVAWPAGADKAMRWCYDFSVNEGIFFGFAVQDVISRMVFEVK